MEKPEANFTLFQLISAIMGRYYFDKKEEADDLRKIQTWFLKKHGYFKGGWRSGTITWSNSLSENKSSISIYVNIFENDNSIKFVYTQTDRVTGEKTNFDYKMLLTTTPCHLGGKRYWFICSTTKAGVYCGKRVGVLYKGGDYFACRHCYDLSYESKNENRRFREYGLFYVLKNEYKVDELKKKIKRRHYKGKPTRKQRALDKLQGRETPYILDLYRKKVLTR